jgi:hypothetical protein
LQRSRPAKANVTQNEPRFGGSFRLRIVKAILDDGHLPGARGFVVADKEEAAAVAAASGEEDPTGVG